MSTGKDTKLSVFEGRQIRKSFHDGEWWFSIIDVIEVLVRGDDDGVAPVPGFSGYGAAEKGCQGRRGGGRQNAQGH